jgi:membrane protein YdbS with pleckstrin-like domain
MHHPSPAAVPYLPQLDRDVVRFNSARNDLCCHIATTSKAVPLDKIQDVEVNKNAILTCFGLKSVNIQTAGQGAGPMPEVSAQFLQNPEQVRDAIQLAAKLAKQHAAGGAPQQAAGMTRSSNTASSGAAGGPSTLLSRLQRLKGLVEHQVLTAAEADSIQAQVLGAESDPLGRLVEAAQLLDLQQLSAEEFEAVKAVILKRLMVPSS